MVRVTEGAVTSSFFKIRGQMSKWHYPHPRLTPEHCEILRNVNLSERGTALSRYGVAKYSQSSLAGGEIAVGLWQGKFANGTIRTVIVTPTAIYNDDGTTRSTITGTALTGGNDDRVRFVFLKDQLIIQQPVDEPRVWNGNTGVNTSDLATVPWTKVDDMFAHKNLLVALAPTESGTKFPTRARWCDINRSTYVVDINSWPSTNRYEIYDGGAPIVGGVDAWGKAMIFKEDGLYPGEIHYDVLGHYDFRLERPLRGFSPVSRMSLVSRPEFIFGAATEGLFVIQPDMSLNIVNNDDITEWLGLNQGRLQHSQAFVREKEHQVRLICSSDGNTASHDRTLVWDWDTGDVWLDDPTVKMNYGASIFVSNEELDFIGGTDSYLYQGNRTSYEDDDGTGFPWRIKMAPNDLGIPGKSKHILNIRTFHRYRKGSANVSLKLHFDEGRSSTENVTLDMSSAYKWEAGTPKWDSGTKWLGEGARVSDFFCNRMCETIAPEWTGNNPASVEGYQVEYILLDA